MVLVIYIILGNTFAIIHSLIHCWNVYCINVNRVLFICIRVCLLPVFLVSVEIWLFNTFCVNLNTALKGILFTIRSRNTLHILKLLVNRGIQTSDTIYLKLGCSKLFFFVKCHIQILNLLGRAIKSIKHIFQKSDLIHWVLWDTHRLAVYWFICQF